MLSQVEFSQVCYEKFLAYFDEVKRGKGSDLQKGRLEGFMQAAELLGIVERARAQGLMEQAHMQVFGETIAERERRKKALKEYDEEWLAIPSVQRQVK